MSSVAVGLLAVAVELARAGAADETQLPATTASAGAQTSTSARALTATDRIDAEIAGQDVHAYAITLEAGHHAHVVVEQGAIDLAVTHLGPGGERVADVDGRWHGPESVSIASVAGGTQRLELRSVQGSATPRRYSIRLVAARPPTDADRQRMAAEQLATSAKAMLAKPSAASLKGALETYRQALPLWQAVGDRYGEAQTLNGLGFVLLAGGNLTEAAPPFESAGAIWRDLGYATGEAETLGNLAVVYSRRGQKRQAIALYERTLTIRQGDGSASALATLINLAAVHGELGDAAKSLEYSTRALAQAEQNRDRAAAQAAVNNIAAAHEMLGDTGRALEFYDRGAALCREANDARCSASLLLNQGASSRRIGDAARALRQFEEAAAIGRTLPDRTVYAMAVLNQGAAHQMLSRLDDALARFTEALVIFQTLKNARGEALARLQIGEIHRQRHELDPAMQHFDAGLTLMRTIGDARSEAQAYHAIARVHLARAAPSAARDHLDRALRLARSTGDVHVEADVLLELARLDRDHGALGDARTHVEDALRIVEGLRARVVRQPLRTVLLAARQEYYETAVDTLMRLHASQGTGGFDALALETSERARARGLLDLLAESGADVREGVDAALLDRERSLRQRLNTKSDRQVALAAAALTAPAAVELGREIDETIADLQAVEASVRRQSPRYAALTEPPVLSVNDLRRDVLDDDTALVEYALGDEQSFAWALTTTGLVSARLPPRGVIERAARDVYDAMTARSQRAPGESAAAWVQRVRGADRRLDAAAAALSDLVLAPVAAGLGKPRLLVVSDGALAFLPFAVLPDPAAPDRRPLLVSHEIVTAPSASVLALLRRELAGRPAPPLTAAVIADPVFTADDPRVTRKGAAARTPVRAPAVATNRSAAPGVEPLAAAPDQIPLSALARLVATRDDARAIRALAPGKRSMEAFDFQANLATATSPVLAQYSIVHFATHTLIDTERPELSAIVLSLVTEAGDPRPGLLRLHDIYNLRLPVDLVVLSACQTALGRAVRGEGLLGLSRGFMYAGAPRVVVSLWKVDDQATSVLMHHFYEAMLRGGLAPAAALRAAQRRMRDDPAWSHPFHWAGFVLQGEWRPR